ncbi:MAG TPA: hypothetical protein VMX17_02895, partial [Candidatus Glassbacteria bacterium]|nr:hypothetical protein [Candidatus Glassbacteria bacterium]
AKLMTQYQTEPLETELVDIDKQMADLSALYETAISQEKGRSAPGAIIRARQAKFSEEQRIELDRLTRQKMAIQEQLNVKYNMINTVMNLKQMDYQTARQNYEWEYNKAVQAQQLLSTEQDRMIDNARANFNIISNLGISWDEMETTMQNQITKIEMQGGLPVGTYKAIAEANVFSEIKWTGKGIDTQGNEIMSFFGVDKDGIPKLIKAIPTGGYKAPATEKPTSTEIKTAEITAIEQKLLASKGTDGYVDPGVYLDKRTKSTLSPDEFNKRFSYLLSPQEQKNLGIVKEKTNSSSISNESLIED